MTDATELSAAELTKEHNLKPECAEKLAAGDELAEDDPCWENYTQVGMKTDASGNEVPNCVPDDDVPDAEGYENSAALSEARVLAHRTLAGPITRKEQSDGSVVYENIKILSAGNWTDSNSRETIRYDPQNLEVVDGAPVNVMHDSNNDVAQVGEIEASSAQVEDGDLYADVRLHRDNAASEFADENLQKTLESEGRKGFGGPSVEIPAEGQEIDTTSEPPELEDGKIDGLAFVNQPAAKTTAFDQQVRERAVAMSDGDNDKGVYVQDTGMSELELQDPGEIREILSMFGFDPDELDDDEIMDMAEDLHEDLMEELGGEDVEAEEDGEEGEEDDGMDMGDMAEQIEAMEQKMEEMKAKEEEMESEMQSLKESMDMAYHAEEAEELEAELEDTKAELSEAKDRLKELEDEPEDPKSLSEDSNAWETTETNLRYDSARQSF